MASHPNAWFSGIITQRYENIWVFLWFSKNEMKFLSAVISQMPSPKIKMAISQLLLRNSTKVLFCSYDNLLRCHKPQVTSLSLHTEISEPFLSRYLSEISLPWFFNNLFFQTFQFENFSVWKTETGTGAYEFNNFYCT